MLRLWLLILCACGPTTEPARRTVFDFETDEGWVVEEGDVWAGPSFRAAPTRRHGEGFLGTAETAEGTRNPALRGTLRSPAFVVDHDYLLLRAGISGAAKGCAITVRAAGHSDDLHRIVPKEGRMLTHIWDARDVFDKRIMLRLVDSGEDDKACSVHIDWVRLVDE